MTEKIAGLTATGVDRRTFLKYTGALSAAGAITASLAACGGGSSSASGGGTQKGGGKAIGTVKHPKGTITATAGFQLSGGFDPMNASSAVATAINAHIFEGLVELDPVTRKPYLALASAQPTASSDGMTWTATLRDGAKFSDGTPVTADDVAWSFNRVIDPSNAALLAGFVSFLKEAKAKDKKTVEFHLKEPFSLFPERISVVKIVPKSKTGTKAQSKAFDSKPIGTGPYKLDSASATTGCVMSNNTHYNGDRGALVTKIVYNTSTNNSARMNDLKGGQAQAIEAVPYLDVKSLTSEYQVDEQSAFNCLFLMFNCSAAPFDDKRVRQALFYGIDAEKLVSTSLNGFGAPATSYLDKGNAYFQEADTVYSYDPGKAKKLLKEAGVTDLSFELVTTDTPFIVNSAPLIISQWKKIGVDAKLNTAPSASVYGSLVPSKKFRVLAASGDPSVYGPDADLLLRWYYYGETWPKDRMRWTDAQFDKCTKLIDKAARAKGSAQKALWKQVFDLIAEDVPLYPVYHTKVVTGSNTVKKGPGPTKLTGFKGAPTTGLYFLDDGVTA